VLKEGFMTVTLLPFILTIWSEEYKRYIVQNYSYVMYTEYQESLMYTGLGL
jgi:hypothetical protein